MAAHEMPQEICLLQMLEVSGVSEQPILSLLGGNLFLLLMEREELVHGASWQVQKGVSSSVMQVSRAGDPAQPLAQPKGRGS